MNTTFASIEHTVSRLDSEVKFLTDKTKRTDEAVRRKLKESVEFNDGDISDFENEIVRAFELRKQILYMETYSRRENIKFVGLPEEPRSNTTKRLKRGYLQIFGGAPQDWPATRTELNFKRIHRLGRPNGTRPSPIIARFLRYGDKQLVMDQARKKLKGTEFHVYDDILKTLYDSRKGQLKKLQEAREKGYTAFFSKAHPDKLFVNGKYIAPGESV